MVYVKWLYMYRATQLKHVKNGLNGVKTGCVISIQEFKEER